MTETVKYRDLFPRKAYILYEYTQEELDAAVLAEREACAKVCAMMEWRGRSDEAIWKGDAADECAAAIRARGEK